MEQFKVNVNPDLQKERDTATFNVEEFKLWWAGGRKKLAEKRHLEKIFLNDPELDYKIPPEYLSYKESHEENIRLISKATKKFYTEVMVKEIAKNGDEWEMLRKFRNIHLLFIGVGVGKNGTSDHVHFGLYLPTLLSQCTDEQKKEWFTKALNMEMIATYAQTELGHGTNLKGMETTAKYDPRTEEFVLNSPTLTSYKWWPGGLGQTNNYAVVMATLLTKGKNYGIQPFIVQIRDEETHMPLRGIVIGDIGSKMGLNNLNNGYLGFNNVRIPRKQMLMKNSQVKANGDFKSTPLSVLSFGASMLFVRLGVVNDAYITLMVACVIVTRYSAVRRQSPIGDDTTIEPQIMDHLTQQAKVFPQIAKTIVFKLISDNAWNFYTDVMKEIKVGNFNHLPELHAITCGLKAIFTSDTNKGTETLRMACGGHGYADYSNMPSIYCNNVSMCTYDGENTVLLLQTAKYLLKQWNQLLQGKLIPQSLQYFRSALDVTTEPLQDWQGCIIGMIDALEYSTARKVRKVYENIEKKKMNGTSQQKAFNIYGIQLVRIGELHTRVYIARKAIELLKNLKKASLPVQNVIKDAFELYVANEFMNNIEEVLQYIPLTSQDVNGYQGCFERALLKFRPNAVTVVDGFDVHEKILNSALGSNDGNVYERIFDMVKENPLNKELVNRSFEMYLKPLIKSKL